MLRYSHQIFTVLFVLIILSASVSISYVYFVLIPKLPDIQTLKNIKLQTPLRIFSAEGQLLGEFAEKRRIPVAIQDIPESLIHAFLSAEDDRFYQHFGVDYQGLLRAAYILVTSGSKTQGGSTITMQLARNFFLSSEKTYLRKLNEIILAIKIEQSLSKDEILTLYLNKIYLGNRAYGVGAAAKVYYGKTLAELALPEMAMIAGLPKAPSKFNPLVNPDRAKIRRDYILKRMWDLDYISEKDYLQASKEPITARYHTRVTEVHAPYVAEMVRSQLTDEYGDDAYTDGFKVYTTIRASHQKALNKAVQTALLDYDRRHGYRGAIAHIGMEDNNSNENLNAYLEKYLKIGPLFPAIVITVSHDKADIYIKGSGPSSLLLPDLKWARKKKTVNSMGPKPAKVGDVLKVGDIVLVEKLTSGQWLLAQLPEVQGAMLAVAPHDGAITALKGGFDFFNNKFNRVTQSQRQPGSGFKPFIYSAALEKGYTAASIINDAPVVVGDPALEEVWRPENSSRKFYGPTRLRSALTYSRNLVSIRLLRDIGADYVVNYALRFGFKPAQLHKNLSLALGSGSASTLDMARAYSALANGGFRIEPYLIQRIEDTAGNIIHQAQPATVCKACAMKNQHDNQTLPPAKRIMSAQNNFIMNSLLRDVIKHGTARGALKLGRTDLAGKTGTTNDQLDAWFNGFHPELVANCWVGFDIPATLGRRETGGRAALPMWIAFMKEVLPDLPQAKLQKPVGMKTVRIDPESGLLARPNADNAIYETFRKEYVPTQIAPAENGFNTGGATEIELF